jgi:hypothetical protein
MTSTVVPADDDLVELQPCPFCSRDGACVEEDGDDGYCFVLCTCSAEGPLRASEAEAIAAWNTRASLSSELARCRNALEGVRRFLVSAPLESGVCCCGSPVEGHGFGDGHSPVDELAYAAMNQVEAIDAALNPIGEEGAREP